MRQMIFSPNRVRMLPTFTRVQLSPHCNTTTETATRSEKRHKRAYREILQILIFKRLANSKSRVYAYLLTMDVESTAYNHTST